MQTPPEGLQARVTRLLDASLRAGGYRLALVCTDRGLPIAVVGDGDLGEDVSALVALLEDIVHRVRRDLARGEVDELIVLDRRVGRLIVRPIEPAPGTRLFVVIDADRHSAWRRNTNQLCLALTQELAELCTMGAF